MKQKWMKNGQKMDKTRQIGHKKIPFIIPRIEKSWILGAFIAKFLTFILQV